MSNFLVAQLTYVSVILLLCFVASTFYCIRPLKKIKHNINSDKYLALFFLIFACAFVVFCFSLFKLNVFLVFANNTLFIISFACLKAAFVSRHSDTNKRLLFDKSTLLMYLMCTTTNLSLYLFMEGSLVSRTVILIGTASIILYSVIPLVALKPDEPSLGEKLAIKAFTLSIFIMLVLMAALIVISNPFYYVSVLTTALAVLIITLFGATSTMFLTEVADMYYKESSVDFLTGLFNRRHFFASSEQIVKLAQRQGFDIAIIMGDIDDFKFVNDIFGHDVGDQVIVDFASIIEELTRDTDITARFGGEEFCLLLPYTNIKGATELAERIRTRINQTIITTQICDVRYTASFGISYFDPQKPLNAAIIQADRALYYAKEQGKDTVTQYTNEMKLGN